MLRHISLNCITIYGKLHPRMQLFSLGGLHSGYFINFAKTFIYVANLAYGHITR